MGDETLQILADATKAHVVRRTAMFKLQHGQSLNIEVQYKSILMDSTMCMATDMLDEVYAMGVRGEIKWTPDRTVVLYRVMWVFQMACVAYENAMLRLHADQVHWICVVSLLLGMKLEGCRSFTLEFVCNMANIVNVDLCRNAGRPFKGITASDLKSLEHQLLKVKIGDDILWACSVDKTCIDVLYVTINAMQLDEYQKIQVLQTSCDVMEVMLYERDMTIMSPLNTALAILTAVMHVKGLVFKIRGEYTCKWHDSVQLALVWNNKVWTHVQTRIHQIVSELEIEPYGNAFMNMEE